MNEAVDILSETQEPDIAASHQFGDRVMGFVSESARDTTESMGQAKRRIFSKFRDVEGATEKGLLAIQDKGVEQLNRFEAATKQDILDLETLADIDLQDTVLSLDPAFTDVNNQVEEKLKEALIEFKADLQPPLDAAEAKVSEAVQGGLAKNEEALGKLDGKMRSAASKKLF